MQLVLIILSVILVIGIIGVVYWLKQRSDYIQTYSKTYDTFLEDVYIDPLSVPYIKNGKVDQNKLFHKTKPMDRDIQVENLLLLKRFLDAYSIKYYIDAGTLLGAVREQGLIEGDTDADMSMSEVDLNRFRSHLPELEQLGFISFRNSPNWMAMSLLRKGEYIDFYTHFKERIPFEVVPYPFLGTEFLIPKHYDEWLTEHYGNWRVPIKGEKGLGNWEKGMRGYVKKWTVPEEEKEFDIIRDIVHFRYKPTKYINWVKVSPGPVDTSVDLKKEPPIWSKFDYRVGTPYPGQAKTVLCDPDKALSHSFAELSPLAGGAKRVLVVMGEDTHSDKLSSKAKNRIMARFSTVFWEANKDPDFLTLPMGLNTCYVALQGTYAAEQAILGASCVTDRKLLCVPAWNTFSTELAKPSAKRWASGAVAVRERLGNFIAEHKDEKWFDSKKWNPPQYYSGLSQYKFSACPTGNGIQAPKIFESLLVRTIPIVEDALAFRQLVQLGLPLLIVESWEEMTEENLSRWYQQMKVDWNQVLYLCSTRGVMDVVARYTN